MRRVVTLESSKLFRHLPAGELLKLRAVSRESSFAAGQPIFKEGDPGDGMYIVKTGQVQISALLETGERQILSQVSPGDVFGEMAVLDNQPRSASASAECDSIVYFVPRDELVTLFQDFPDLALNMVQEISGRLREFNRQYIRKVLQAERMALVGRFASSIVHDLKNPLTIIRIAADQAGDERATLPDRKLAQRRTGQQVERITNLVNDILEFTRGTPATLPVIPMDYAAFVKSVVEEFKPEVALKSVTIEFENQPPSVKLPLNPKRLSRVFYNLVLNAVDAMPGGGRIKLRFAATETEVITELEDTGPGIAPEIAEHLFEAFATYGKAKGTGLGLSISQRIIGEHLGKISARTEAGRGAIFSFSLPKQRP
jgi:signal transduction histidine kinase